jgi:hypothetical protein
MSKMLSDPRAFFSAACDLAYKKILPSPQAMVERWRLAPGR